MVVNVWLYFNSFYGALLLTLDSVNEYDTVVS